MKVGETKVETIKGITFGITKTRGHFSRSIYYRIELWYGEHSRFNRSLGSFDSIVTFRKFAKTHPNWVYSR